MDSSSFRALEPPFLNAPGNVFLLDLIKVMIPSMLIPFIALVTLLIIFPKALYFDYKRKRRSFEQSSSEISFMDRIPEILSAGLIYDAASNI